MYWQKSNYSLSFPRLRQPSGFTLFVTLFFLLSFILAAANSPQALSNLNQSSSKSSSHQISKNELPAGLYSAWSNAQKFDIGSVPGVNTSNPAAFNMNAGKSPQSGSSPAIIPGNSYAQQSDHHITPRDLQQQTVLTAQDAVAGDSFGFNVGLSEDSNTAIVSADTQKSSTGAAYVFTRNNGNWTFQQKLTAQDAAPGDTFGGWMVLSGDGNTALVGAYTKNTNTGAAYVFNRGTDGVWRQQQKLTASDAASGDNFGGWVAISRDGNTSFISAVSKNSYAGAVYVFTRNSSGSWTQLQKLTASDSAPGDSFGSWLGLSGDGTTAIIGAYGKNSSAGAVYVFGLVNNVWTQQQKLTASDSAPGDQFGFASTISRDGNTAVIGAALKNSGSGEAYVYVRGSNGTWSLQQILKSQDLAAGDEFGFALALSGDGNVAGITAETKNSNKGAAYIFRRSNGTWSQQQEIVPSDAVANDKFGTSIALTRDGNTALIGASGKNSGTGATYVYSQVAAAASYRISAPVSAVPGTPISVTITVLDQFGNVFPGYTGTIHFTSSDASAILPADYTFTAAENGTHTFTNAVKFNTAGNQTLTVSDVSAPSVTGTVTIAVQSGNTYVYNLPFLGYQSNGFTSYLSFQNIGTGTATFTLQYFKPDGTPFSSAALIGTCTNLVPRAECLPPNPFDLGDSGSGVIVSNQPLAVVVAEATPYGGSAYAVSAGSSNSLVAPIILHNAYGDFSTRLTVFNGGATTVAATIQFYDQNGNLQAGATQNVNIAPHVGQIFDQSLATSNLPSSFNGWARISSPAGNQLVAQVLEQSPIQHFVAIANAQVSPHTTLYAPAIFKGGFGFNTGFNLVNPGSTSVNVTVTYYDDNGTAYAASPFSLAANAIASIYQGGGTGTGLPAPSGLPSGFTGAAIISTDGTSGVVMVVNESGGVTSTGTALSGVYSAAASGSNAVSLPVMANGGFGYKTGATIFNTSGVAVSGNIQYYDITGQPIGPLHPFNIGPFASQLAYQGAAGLPDQFYGTALVTQTSGGGSSGLIVTTNALSGLFYTYTEPSQ